MMGQLFWVLIAIQLAMGAFDIVFHHELTERLSWKPSQRRELLLHAARNLIYALVFAVLGWVRPQGIFALAVMTVLAVEVVITLADFVEEDRTRKLPASERVTHALLALNYGAVLALLMPMLWGWAQMPDALVPVYHGLPSLMMLAAAFGVLLFGARDLATAGRLEKMARPSAAGLVESLPPGQTVLVTGATGFIGSRLVEGLLARGHRVLVLTRDPQKAARLGAPLQILTSLDQIDAGARIDAVINLAGEPTGAGLWTIARKRKLMASRLEVTAAVVGLIARLKRCPAVLVNASAIGWYGLHGDGQLTEESAGHDCFSRELCVAWEAEADKAAAYGVRVVRLRIGLVLGTEGGVLSQLLLPFEFGAGGRIGSGRQWMSWIARDDLVRLIVHTMATPSLEGAVNGTAPAPERNSVFVRALGRALHRPSILPLPALPLRLLGGDFAKELLLGGQRALPAKAMASGFVFRYPHLDEALRDMLGAGRPDHFFPAARTDTSAAGV
jgi:uncharacterized protein (TIGR01777 family)